MSNMKADEADLEGIDVTKVRMSVKTSLKKDDVLKDARKMM